MKTTFALPRAVRGFFLGGLVLLLCGTSWAATFTVNATTDTGAGSGTSGDLRYCVTHAASGDTITFATTLSGATITLGSEIVFTNNLTIDGSSLPSSVILSGNNAHRIFSNPSGVTLTLKTLTLTAGNGTGATATGNGGAIYNAGTVNLTQCTLYGNTVSGGGGAIATVGGSSTTTLTNCTIANNTANFGGGINLSSGTLVLEHCTVASNTGTAGTGGMVWSGGTVGLKNTIVAGNTAGNGVTDVDIGGAGATGTIVGNNLIGQNAGSYNTGALAPGAPNAQGDYVGTNGSPVLAHLSTLGNYGGPVQTMPPTTSSTFVIDTVTSGNVVAGLTTDARGNARSIDGNSDGTALPDIGAVDFIPATFLTVSTTQDTGIGSLRQAIANAAQLAGAQSLNLSAVAGQTITLASTIAINSPGGLTMDASGLSGGLTVSGAGASGSFGLFTNAVGSTVTFKGLTLANGGGSNFSGGGGAISNSGTATLAQCTLAGNSTTGLGGAILNTGFVTLTQCTLSSNSATSDGGAITSTNPGNTATLTQCTLSGNSTTGTSSRGGAIGGFGTLTLTQCTISGNSASGSSGKGGGVFVGVLDALTLTNSIIAGNTSPTGPDIDNNSGTITLTGANFIGDLSTTGKSASSTLLDTAQNGAINLAPLGNYGGPTPTMPPLVGSPAINAAVGSTFTKDQRGLSITDGKPDLGAVEAVFTQVTNTSPSGAGSFTQAITTASSSGHAVSFAPGLSGQTITLTGTVTLTRGMIIDGSGLASGVTISGAGPNGDFGLFSNASGSTAFFKGLTLANGGGSNFGNGGGAINNSGTMTLTQCTLSGNSADNGGAIDNERGTMTLTQCTLSGNSATPGNGGGGIWNVSGTMTLTQCTLSGNSVDGGIGGAIANLTGTLNLANSIIAGNTAPTDGGPDIYNNTDNSINLTGANFIGDPSDSGLSASSTLLTTAQNGAINLAATLGSYGGPTQTLPPQAGSPAINAAVGSTFTTDQRGCPIVGTADLGAAECSIVSPTPGNNGSLGLGSDTFSWTGPAGAAFKFYLGSSATALSLAASPGTTASAMPSSSFAPGGTYYWRVDSTLGGVTFTGPVFSFMAPSINTDAATTVQAGFATLNGSLNPNGAATTAYFQYGATTSYGSTTPVINMGSGSTAVATLYNLFGLTKSTTYHYRLVVVSGGTTYFGADLTFTTPASSGPSWHSGQVSALTDPSMNNMADGARTGVADTARVQYWYKGTNSNIWVVWLNGSNWTQTQLTGDGNVSDWLTFGGQYNLLCYAGKDNQIWCVYWTGTAWATSQLGVVPGGTTIAGDLAIDNSWNTVYFRGADNLLHCVCFNGKAWVYSTIGTNPTANVHGNIAVDEKYHLVYYQGIDNNLWAYQWTGSAWVQNKLTSTSANMGGAISVDVLGQTVYYRSSIDSSTACVYWSGKAWVQETLVPSANISASATSFSLATPYTSQYNNLYIDGNNQAEVFWFNGSAWTHGLLGDGSAGLTGGLSLQPVYHWVFARRSDGNIIIFYYQ